MVCEHKDRGVERRVVAPPAVPGIVLIPRTGAAPKHVATHHGRTHVRLNLLDHSRAGVYLSAFQTMLPAPRLELDDPFVQTLAAEAQRVLFALVGAGNEAVQRHRNLEPELAHHGLLQLTFLLLSTARNLASLFTAVFSRRLGQWREG